jgi:ADP-ribosyl-[dinitrogen reductase] hydrolase
MDGDNGSRDDDGDEIVIVKVEPEPTAEELVEIKREIARLHAKERAEAEQKIRVEHQPPLLGEVGTGADSSANGVPLTKVRGAILGSAIGDALGYPIEFASGPEIIRRYGSLPPQRLDYAGSGAVFSDDTQMTLFSAEGLIRALLRWRDKGFCDPPTIIQRAYHRWYRTQTAEPDPLKRDGWLILEPGLFVRRAPGNTCLAALAQTAQSGHVPTVADPPNDSKGCGAVMRSAPFGVIMHSRQRAFEEARDAGALTHGHPSGYLSAAYLAAVVFDVIRGTSLTESMHGADERLARERGHAEMAAAVTSVRAIVSEGPPSMSAIKKLGGGWVGEEALGIALTCALTCQDSSPESLAAALWRSVAHGGDSNSTGSLTGNLLGAMYGIESLPPAWLDELQLRAIVGRIACDMHAALADDPSVYTGGYPPN